MQPRIGVLTIGMDDLERLLRFYRDGLDLQTPGTVVFFDLQGGLKLALWPRDHIARDAKVPGTSQSPTEFTIGHNVRTKHDVDVVMIEQDGPLSNRRIWALLGDGVPDGICLDADGAVCRRRAEQAVRARPRRGEVLQTVELKFGCFACMLGGVEGKTLFMVVREWRGIASAADSARTSQVLAIDVIGQHAGWP